MWLNKNKNLRLLIEQIIFRRKGNSPFSSGNDGWALATDLLMSDNVELSSTPLLEVGTFKARLNTNKLKRMKLK